MSRQVTVLLASEIYEKNQGRCRDNWVTETMSMILSGEYSIHHDECGGIYTNLESVVDEVIASSKGVESAVKEAFLGDVTQLEVLVIDEAVRQLQNLADGYEIGK